MKKPSIIALALLGISTVAVHAADLAYKGPRTQTSVVSERWGGFHIGLNGGYSWSDQLTKLSGDDAISSFVIDNGFVPNTAQTDWNGAFGGVQVGYGWQSGVFVLQAVADFSIADISGSRTSSVGIPPFASISTTTESSMDWFSTIRAKVGFDGGGLLLYGTGGVMVADVEHKTSGAINSIIGNVSYSGSSSGTEWGWVAGAGLEYALSTNWSLFAEYLRYELDDSTYTVTASVPGVTATAKAENQGHLFKAGVNYRFN